VLWDVDVSVVTVTELWNPLSQVGVMMNELKESDREARRGFRSFVMRHPWPPFLVVCGILGIAGYRLGVTLALWYQPGGSGVVGVLWSLPVAALVGLAWGRVVPWSRHPELMKRCLMSLGAVGLLLASCAPESKFLPYPYVDTCFAPGFDRYSFERLHPGMSTAEVEALTGAPRFRHPPTWGYQLAGNPDLVWVYSTDHCSWFGDYAWRSYQVGFRNGAVVVVSTAWRYD